MNQIHGILILIIAILINIYINLDEIQTAPPPPPRRRIVLIQLATPHVEATDDQNVHDSNVRRELWDKFYRLKEEVGRELQPIYGRGWLGAVITNSLAEAANTYRDDPQIMELLTAVGQNEGIISTENFTHQESEIFGIIWYKFHASGLDPAIMCDQLHNCFEDGELVCVVGRVSRYISVFSGVTDDYLGKSEITEKLLFAEALNKSKVHLDYYLNKNPQYKDAYTRGEEHPKLDGFLTRVRRRIKQRLSREYPRLSASKIDEILEAI